MEPFPSLASTLPTNIDLSSPYHLTRDSVVGYCMKVGYKAHQGRYIEGLFETPVPAAVNPLSATEVFEWGADAMEFNVKQPSGAEIGASGFVLSEHSNFGRYTQFDHFKGYRSAAPTSKIMIEDEPVGPAAKAIKAAGTLAAALDVVKEDDKWVWNLLEKVWGVDASQIKAYIKPSTHNTSKRDLMKFIRHKFHTLSGFNSTAPKAAINMGRYTPQTMMTQAYVDWHKIALSLHFMGEWAANYNKLSHGRTQEYRTFFALAMQETIEISNAPLTPKWLPEDIREPPELIKRVANATLEFYTADVTKLKVAKYVGASIVTSDVDLELGPAVVRSIVLSNKRETARPIYKIGGAVLDHSEIYEVSNVPTKVIFDNINTLYDMTAHKACVMTTAAWLISKKASQQFQVIRQLADSSDWLNTGKSRNLLKYGLELVRNLPEDHSRLCMQILIKASNSVEAAELKMASFIKSFAEPFKAPGTVNRWNLLKRSFLSIYDPDPVAKMLKSSLVYARTTTHKAANLIYESIPSNYTAVAFVKMLDRYMKSKIDYWVRHYTSRWRKYAMAKRVGMMGIDKSAVDYYTVLYQFLSQLYSIVKFEVSEDLEISYLIPPTDFVLKIGKSAYNYANKRRAFDEKIQSFEDFLLAVGVSNSTRILCDIFDHLIQPTFKYTDLWLEAKKRLDITTSSASKTLCHRLEDAFRAELSFTGPDKSEVDFEADALSQSIEYRLSPEDLAEMDTLDINEEVYFRDLPKVEFKSVEQMLPIVESTDILSEIFDFEESSKSFSKDPMAPNDPMAATDAMADFDLDFFGGLNSEENSFNNMSEAACVANLVVYLKEQFPTGITNKDIELALGKPIFELTNVPYEGGIKGLEALYASAVEAFTNHMKTVDEVIPDRDIF